MSEHEDLDDMASDEEAGARMRELAVDKAQARYADAARAQVGATIRCAYCGRLIVKARPAQKFCPGASHRCKDRYHNLVNPRGFRAPSQL